MYSLILMICGVVPIDHFVEDRVDVFHRSHVYNPRTGEERLDQIGGMIFHPEDSRYHWHWWRRTADTGPPQRDQRDGGWVLNWYDKYARVHRRVRATSYRETHSLYDPEMRDRRELPLHARRGLAHSVNRTRRMRMYEANPEPVSQNAPPANDEREVELVNR